MTNPRKIKDDVQLSSDQFIFLLPYYISLNSILRAHTQTWNKIELSLITIPYVTRLSLKNKKKKSRGTLKLFFKVILVLKCSIFDIFSMYHVLENISTSMYYLEKLNTFHIRDYPRINVDPVRFCCCTLTKKKIKVQFGVSQKNHFPLFYKNNFLYLFTQSNAIKRDL